MNIDGKREGEGELKIIQWINEHMPKNNNETIAILGQDSDILLQSITLLISFLI